MPIGSQKHSGGIGNTIWQYYPEQACPLHVRRHDDARAGIVSRTLSGNHPQSRVGWLVQHACPWCKSHRETSPSHPTAANDIPRPSSLSVLVSLIPVVSGYMPGVEDDWATGNQLTLPWLLRQYLAELRSALVTFVPGACPSTSEAPTALFEAGFHASAPPFNSIVSTVVSGLGFISLCLPLFIQMAI